MWNLINKADKNKLNREIYIRHHAVQVIARAGKHLIPEEPDD